jgi:hypothetical protein
MAPRQRHESQRRAKKPRGNAAVETADLSTASTVNHADDRLAKWLSKDEDKLIDLMVKIDKVFEEKLHKDAPFMT